MTSHVISRGHTRPEFVSSSQFVNEVGKEKPPMIEMVSRSGEPEAMTCPALICDACRQQVVGQGNIVWAERHEPERQSSPLFVSHKGRCDLAVEAGIQSQYPISDGWLDFSAEADQFIRHLAHNADHSFADDPDGSYRIVPVAHPTRS